MYICYFIYVSVVFCRLRLARQNEETRLTRVTYSSIGPLLTKYRKLGKECN